MGKNTYSRYDNPYIDDDEQKLPNAEVILQEQREKWNAAGKRPVRGEFDLDGDRLFGQDLDEAAEHPPAERFKLHESDLHGKPLSLKTLQSLDYSPSYRPVGELEQRTAGVPRSMLQRYEILTGEFEAPPEDVSFLSDALSKRQGESDSRSGKLKRDTKRLDTPVDERRAALNSILPDRDTDKAMSSLERMKRRRDKHAPDTAPIEKQKAAPKRGKAKQKVAVPDDPTEAFRIRELATTRYDRLPEQDGLEMDSPPLPDMETQTRRWSSIDSDNPLHSEIMKHSEHIVPEDEEALAREEEAPRHRTHYIRDEDFDPDRRYTNRISSPRQRLRSNEELSFNNEYLAEMGLEADKVRELISREYRGRWIPPEYFYDDELVNDWFNHFNRGALSGEDFVNWAARQRHMAQQQKLNELRAFQQQMRRGARTPRGNAAAQQRRTQYERARAAGYAQGAALSSNRPPQQYIGQRKPYRGQYPELFDEPSRQPAGYAPNYPPNYAPNYPPNYAPDYSQPQFNRRGASPYTRPPQAAYGYPAQPVYPMQRSAVPSGFTVAPQYTAAPAFTGIPTDTAPRTAPEQPSVQPEPESVHYEINVPGDDFDE